MIRLLSEVCHDGSRWPALLEQYASGAGPPPGLADALIVLTATVVSVPFFGDQVQRTAREDAMVAENNSSIERWIDAAAS